MKHLNIATIDFVGKGVIGNYKYCEVKRVFNGIGSMKITIDANKVNADQLQIGRLVWLEQDFNKVNIIESIKTTKTQEAEMLEITAVSIDSFLNDRICIPPSGSSHDVQTGARETVVRAWVNNNMINPVDTDRDFNIINSTDNTYGDTITEQARYSVLSEEVTRVLKAQDLGWNVSIDIDNTRFIFNVLQGVDRTEDQAIVSAVVFGYNYGNILNSTKNQNTLSEKTVAYVGGQGEAELRTIQEVDTTGVGSRRREVFVDARDVTTTGELTERGVQKLSTAISINEYKSTIRTTNQYVYETDWDLGDFISLEVDGTLEDKQITQVLEVYAEDRTTVTPIFGEPVKTLSSSFNDIDKRLSNLETTT